MFKTIFFYELKHWSRQPSVYIYAVVFLTWSMLMMHGVCGGWDSPSASESAIVIENSPIKINWMFTFFTRVFIFLIPTIVGVSIYRDYASNMHSVLYSYAFGKRDYIFAKFLSGLVVLILIVSTIGPGIYLGTLLPGVDPARIGPLRLDAYLQTYFLYIVPNLFLFSVIVFGTVALTRNIYAGFIVIVLLYFIQGIASTLFEGLENSFWDVLLDPFAQKAAGFYSRYWTMTELNEQILPIEGVLIYNRLLWLAIASLIFGLIFKFFTFSQDALSLGYRPAVRTEQQMQAPGGILKVELPQISFDHSVLQQMKTAWRLSGFELKYILKNWMFLSILLAGALMIFFQQAQMGSSGAIKILPVTWLMLRIPAFMFSGIINLLTFLYAGLLIQRSRMARMDSLVDATPIADWVPMTSKFLALLKMQAILLMLVMLGGIAAQISRGYDNFEIGHYLFELYAMNFPGHIIWAMTSIFIQTLLINPYMGLFILLLGSIGIMGLPELGIKSFVFRFNLSPEVDYSDLNGYGSYLVPFFVYKIYWMTLAGILFLSARLFWIRGLPESFAERLALAGGRMKGKTSIVITALLLCFLLLGSAIYYENEIRNPRIDSAGAGHKFLSEYREKYQHYEGMVQPRIISLQVNMNIFPDENRFQADGEYLLINKSGQPIDTLLLNTGFDERSTYAFERKTGLISQDSLFHFDVVKLQQALQPGDSMKLYFKIQNMPNTFFRRNSNILRNGTFIASDIFPRFGYRASGITPAPADTAALGNNYQSIDSDNVAFESVVSTASDQVAIAPGYLQREWQEDGRRYFHYKMDGNIKFYFGFNSGRFEIMRDSWKGISLEIYYHKTHTYNLQRMMRGLKASLAYHEKFFSPYQHRQARIIEFPVSEGSHATTFANSIPFSELRFIADVDDRRDGSIDFPFYVAVHELAHQWWGNQVVPANTLGAKMVTEGLSEYVSLKVLEQQYGISKMRTFLKYCLDSYLRERGNDRQEEKPLMLCEHDQEYIAYRKGALVFYALSDYIGEAQLNRALKKYLEKVRFQGPPYTTSIELMDHIRAVLPDSLNYLLRDMFETVTLYDNRISEATVTPLKNGQYRVDMEFLVSKYRTDGRGKQFFSDTAGDSLTFRPAPATVPTRSLPLADYIDVGIFATTEVDGLNDERPLYLKRHRIDHINNRMSIVVNQRPAEVGIDPYNKLIDRNSADNRVRL